MTRVSKKGLPQHALQRMFTKMDALLANLPVQKTSLLFNELLGNEERIMFAKRLAAIVMCAEGASVYRIAETLLISPSTAARIRNAYFKGRYRGIESLVQKNTIDFYEIGRTLEVILRGGLPPRAGRSRAQFWFKKLPK